MKLFSMLALNLAMSAAFANQVLIENVTVLSPEREQALPSQQVLIRDGRIVAMGPKLSVQGGVERVNGRGKFLTPGLMDSHVHVSMAPGLPFPLPPVPALQKIADDFYRQQPRSYLYHGVTQLLDPSGHPQVQALFQQQTQKPDLFRCGAAPIYNGYPTNFVAPEQRLDMIPEFIFDPESGATLPAGLKAEDYTPEAVVARIKKTGAMCVKVFIEDGFGDAHYLPIPSASILERVRRAAKANQLLVLAHANATDMQRIAVGAKADVIAHGTWNWSAEERATFRQDPTQLPTSVKKLMHDIAENKMAYQPTLSVLPGIAALFRDDTLRDPAYKNVVPSSLMAWYQTPYASWFKELIQKEDEITDVDAFLQMNQRVQSLALRSLNYLYQLGHPVLLASDTPSAPTYGNQPGLNTYREMQQLQAAGVSLRDIFKAGTINNAKQFGLEKDYGTVQINKVANLLLLNANPLIDLSAWDKIDSVIVHGELIKREQLSAQPEQNLGVSSITILDTEQGNYQATLWYPTWQTNTEKLGVTRIRVGYDGVQNAVIADKSKRPLIVLNHGSGGSADSMAWISEALVQQGAIVLAANHPGSSGGEPERESILHVWQQPSDVKRLLDTVLSSAWADYIDQNRIAEIGFSLGGATALQLAGAELKFERFAEFCRGHDDGACRAFAHFTRQFDAGFYRRTNQNFREPRIKAVVALAPGFTEAFTQSSLQSLRTPVLLMTGEKDQQLPPRTHVYPMKDFLPSHSRYVEIEGAHHFSFLPLCNDKAETVLAESNEEFVCQEFGQKTRGDIYQESLANMVMFFKQHKIL